MNIPIFSLYRLKTTKEVDSNLANLLSKSKILTFNQNSLTGFDEIEIVPIREKVESKYVHLLDECEKTYTNFDVLITDLKQSLTNTIHKILLMDGPKVFFTSAGADSRIVAWIVKDLEEKYGKSLTDNIVFVCCHPEGELFKAAMKKIGWDENKYHVHRENIPQSADYYDYGDFTLNMNSFDYPAINFWSDVIPHGKEKDYTAVSGSFGGELLNYPLYKSCGLPDNRYKLIEVYLSGCGFGNAHMTNLWKNAVVPYLSYEYLDIAFRIDKSLYGYYNPADGRQSIDRIRKTILNSFGDTVSCHVGHSYDFSMSKELSQKIQNSWESSKFIRDFGNNQIVIPDTKANVLVRDLKPGYTQRGSIDSKIYGLATTYEHINK